MVYKYISRFFIVFFLIGLCVKGVSQKDVISFNSYSDTNIIINHLTNITQTNGFRNYSNIPLLNQTADYVLSVFKQYADTAYFQEYEVEGKIYRNVIGQFGTHIHKPLIITGAHYDVYGNQEGADDNASGTVALLELARMLYNQKLNYPIELVAYTLEEPPYFRTAYMGSYIHAQSLKASKTKVYGMTAIEMIGYFNDESNSQEYPVKTMKAIYGSKGDYILLVKKLGHKKFVKNFSKQFTIANTIKTSNLKSPKKISGIDFSDHLNYWNAGYDALMVTNTAFYRNKNYHKSTDTMETLDIDRMSKVIDAIYYSLTHIN